MSISSVAGQSAVQGLQPQKLAASAGPVPPAAGQHQQQVEQPRPTQAAPTNGRGSKLDVTV